MPRLITRRIRVHRWLGISNLGGLFGKTHGTGSRQFSRMLRPRCEASIIATLHRLPLVVVVSAPTSLTPHSGTSWASTPSLRATSGPASWLHNSGWTRGLGLQCGRTTRLLRRLNEALAAILADVTGRSTRSTCRSSGPTTLGHTPRARFLKNSKTISVNSTADVSFVITPKWNEKTTGVRSPC